MFHTVFFFLPKMFLCGEWPPCTQLKRYPTGITLVEELDLTHAVLRKHTIACMVNVPWTNRSPRSWSSPPSLSLSLSHSLPPSLQRSRGRCCWPPRGGDSSTRPSGRGWRATQRRRGTVRGWDTDIYNPNITASVVKLCNNTTELLLFQSMFPLYHSDHVVYVHWNNKRIITYNTKYNNIKQFYMLRNGIVHKKRNKIDYTNCKRCETTKW